VDTENTPEPATLAEPHNAAPPATLAEPANAAQPPDEERPASTRSGSRSRSGDVRPPAPRPAHPRRSDPGTVDFGRVSPSSPPAAASEADTGAVPGLAAPSIDTGPTDPRPTVGFGVPPAVAPEPAMPTNIYRARRPGVAILLIVPAVVAGLFLVRALAISAFGRTFLIDGVLASSLALASLPLLVSGLYGLVTGAAHGAEQWGFRVWARPPLAYLVVGIAFVVAAGLAIS
jgi:hypothetical protein